jgi:spore coat protein U-like protein
MYRNAIAPMIATGILIALGGSAQAASTRTTTFNVSATVADNCLVSASDLAFGNFTAAGDVTNSSSVKVRCTSGTLYTVKLSAGSGTFGTRKMMNGSSFLAYNLYKDAGYTSIWGDGTGSTATNGGTGTGLSSAKEVTYTVFGKLPVSGNEDAPVGNYADTITVSVDY